MSGAKPEVHDGAEVSVRQSDATAGQNDRIASSKKQSAYPDGHLKVDVPKETKVKAIRRVV